MSGRVAPNKQRETKGGVSLIQRDTSTSLFRRLNTVPIFLLTTAALFLTAAVQRNMIGRTKLTDGKFHIVEYSAGIILLRNNALFIGNAIFGGIYKIVSVTYYLNYRE